MMNEGRVSSWAKTTGARTKRFFTHWAGRMVRITPRTRQSSVPSREAGMTGTMPSGGSLDGGLDEGTAGWIRSARPALVRAASVPWWRGLGAATVGRSIARTRGADQKARSPERVYGGRAHRHRTPTYPPGIPARCSTGSRGKRKTSQRGASC